MLYLSGFYALERGSNALATLAEAAYPLPGGDVAAVTAVHESFRANSPAGSTLRKRYASAIFLQDNAVRASYTFPDEVALERIRLEREIGAARQDLTLHQTLFTAAQNQASMVESRKADLAAAADLVNELQVKLDTLVPGSTAAATLTPAVPQSAAPLQVPSVPASENARTQPEQLSSGPILAPDAPPVTTAAAVSGTTTV